MSTNKLRMILLACFLIPLLISRLINHHTLSIICMTLGCLMSLFLLWHHLPQMTHLSSEHPKLKTVRQVTIFNIVLILILSFVAYLGTRGQLTEQGAEMLMIVLLIVILVFFGNLAPKIPFNRHIGLRLPWTVMDEDTWIVAHRILGYISIPLIFLFLLGIRCGIAVHTMFMTVILSWVIIPGILSLAFYYKKYRK